MAAGARHFTDPIRPATNCFCIVRNSTRTGRVETQTMIMSAPYSMA
jgi:hypothetical protein